MKNNVKIIMCGLQNAGKTSILTALNRKYNFKQAVMKLKPTLKIDYNKFWFLGSAVTIWDMGGQKKFRDLYLSNKYYYLDETDLLFYVIDAQDEENYTESLEYLKKILKFYVNNKMNVPVVLSFHKYDPELSIEDKKKINTGINLIKKKIVDDDELIGFNIIFQQTSIYDIFSIIKFLSYGFSLFNLKYNEMNLTTEKFLTEFDCISLMVMDKNGLIMSEYYKETSESIENEAILEIIQNQMETIKKIEEGEASEDEDYFFENKELIALLHKKQFKEHLFFISTISFEKNKESLLKNIQRFSLELDPILTLIDL